MLKHKLHKLSSFLILSVLFLTTCSPSTALPSVEAAAPPPTTATSGVVSTPTTESTQDTSAEATNVATPTYLPLVNQVKAKFFGIYLDVYWGQDKNDVYKVIQEIDAGAGKKHTSVGWFINLEDTAFNEDPLPGQMKNNLYGQLEYLWKLGYISFINLGTDATAGDINNGLRENQIRNAAQVYKEWVSLGEGRRALIAPLQEMNGVWTSYGKASTSGEIKLAYRHIVSIFESQGVTRDMVWWVFAPNGYSDPGNEARKFENYYPGDDVVDIVGFSSYNYGYCIEYPEAYWRWESYPEIFEPYIARMEVMAPTKPIIIAETASTAYYHDANGKPIIDYDQMNQWLIENYNYFATRSSVIGVFYFSFIEYDGFNCEVEIDPNGKILSGYKDALSNWIYQYFNTKEFDLMVHRFD